MEEKELVIVVQKFIEQGVEDDEIEQYDDLKLDENQYRKIVGVGSLEGLELLEDSQGRTIKGLRILKQNFVINLNRYNYSYAVETKNSVKKIHIEDCEFYWLNFDEHSNYSNLNISIKKTKVYNLVLFGIKAQEVVLTECHLETLHTNHISLNKIELNNCTGSLDFGVEEQASEQMEIHILNGNYESISIKNHESSNIELTNVKCELPISIDGRVKDKKEKLKFNSLIISGNTSEVRVNKYDIDHLSIKDVVHQGNSTYKDIEVKKLTVDSVINLGKITFLNLTALNDVQSKLDINNSTLGNTYFVNSQLSDFKATNIQGVDLTEIKSINTNWPTNISEEDLAQSKEAYRQLKLIMSNGQDKMNELIFFQKENEIHLRELNQKKLSYKHLEYWDRCNLWISRHTNDFGNNYIKPIIVYLISSIILYLFVLLFTYYKEACLVVTYPFIHFDFLDFNLQKLNYYLVKYFEFLNPTHSISFLKGINGISAFLDFFSRILFGFLIYQTISAFRKLYRK